MQEKTYLDFTREVAIYEDHAALDYLINGLASEAGEVAGKWAKMYRGDVADFDVITEQLLDESGDVLWMLTRLVDELGSNMSALRKRNSDKLRARIARNTLQGDGDAR